MKYFLILTKHIQLATAYRVDTINWLIIALLSTLGSFLLFGTASNVGAITNYTQDQMIAYLVLGLVLERLFNWYFCYNIAQEIQSGEINNKYLKPFFFYISYFLQEIGKKFLTNILHFVILISVWLIYKINIHVIGSTLFLGFISLSLGIIINVLISYILGAIAFFTTRATAFISTTFFFD